jgi:hypothetical protein
MGFVQFDISGLSGSVSSAMLKVHVLSVVTPGVLDVHGVLGSWSELTLTHNNKPAYGVRADSVAIATGDAGTVVSLDITALAQQWAASPSTAFGIMLKSPDSFNGTFDTREAMQPPIVEVELQ